MQEETGRTAGVLALAARKSHGRLKTKPDRSCPLLQEHFSGGFMRFEIFITGRYLKSKPRQAFIALISILATAGVAIGVMALIVVIAVMEGFEADLKARILSIEPHVVVSAKSGNLTNHREIAHAIGAVKGVTAFWPVFKTEVMVQSSVRTAGATLKGIAAPAGQGLGISGLQTLISSDTTAGALPPLVLGRALAGRLAVAPGDTVRIIAPRGIITPAGFLPVIKSFRVTAVFETGVWLYDGSLAFGRLKDVQHLMRRTGEATAIEVMTGNVFDAKKISRRISRRLGPGLRAVSWMERNRNLFSAMKLEKTTMFVVLALTILVATVNIFSGLMILVSEKAKDIAVLKAMGATAGHIRTIFLLMGLAVGAAGTLAGTLGGLTLCYLQDKYHLIRLPGDVFYISAFPVNVRSADVSAVAAAALLICLLAAVYPAHRATVADPVEAIRHG